MRDLSIILPTCNRAELLSRAIQSIAAGTQCDYEIIAIDGASHDDTWQRLLDFQSHLGPRLKIIREDQRQGFVKAANRGFREASGRVLCWINDDARPAPSALDQAVEMLHRTPPSVGLLAMFHCMQGRRNIAYEMEKDGDSYRVCHIRGTLYANFAIGRADVFHDLNYFDERYYINGSDPDLSLKAWHAGYTVEPAWGVCIDHDEHDDGRRNEDRPHFASDNQKLFDKWDLPEKNARWNDFDPARPCTLRGLRPEGLREVA